MPDALRLYFRYMALSVRAQMQYRVSFIMQSLGIFLITAVEFVAVYAMFKRFGNLRGWTLPEVALFYGMISITFSIADAVARGFDLVGAIVKAGDFDRILLRPRSAALQIIGQELTLRRCGRLAQGLFVFTYAAHALHIHWPIAKVSLLLASIVGGGCLFTGILILQATSAFWTTETLEIWNSLVYGGVEAAQYPMSIYRPWFRNFFLFVVPLACVNYLPGVAIMGRPDPTGTTRIVQWLSPLAGVVFLAAALQVWKLGIRHYRSTGS